MNTLESGASLEIDPPAMHEMVTDPRSSLNVLDAAREVGVEAYIIQFDPRTHQDTIRMHATPGQMAAYRMVMDVFMASEREAEKRQNEERMKVWQ